MEPLGLPKVENPVTYAPEVKVLGLNVVALQQSPQCVDGASVDLTVANLPVSRWDVAPRQFPDPKFEEPAGPGYFRIKFAMAKWRRSASGDRPATRVPRAVPINWRRV